MRLLHYHINRTMGSEGMLSIECPSILADELYALSLVHNYVQPQPPAVI